MLKRQKNNVYHCKGKIMTIKVDTLKDKLLKKVKTHTV